MVLVCHMILNDHVTKGSNSLMSQSFSKLVTKVQWSHYCGVGDNDFSLSLILQDGVIKGSCGFMAGVP